MILKFRGFFSLKAGGERCTGRRLSGQARRDFPVEFDLAACQRNRLRDVGISEDAQIMGTLTVGRRRGAEDHAFDLSVNYSSVQSVDTHVELSGDGDPGRIDLRESSKQLERAENLIYLHGFERR